MISECLNIFYATFTKGKDVQANFQKMAWNIRVYKAEINKHYVNIYFWVLISEISRYVFG
jgi:hypothetical protein